MTSADEFSELHKRLDDFESRLRQKTRQLEAAGSPAPEHREKIGDMYARSAALREKLQGAGPSSWSAMRKELETEWYALTHAFEHWAEHVDRDYRRRGS